MIDSISGCYFLDAAVFLSAVWMFWKSIVFAPDLKDLIVTYFSICESAGRRVSSSLAIHVCDIFFLCSFRKVRRIYALFVITGVHYQFGGDTSMLQKISESVSLPRLLLATEKPFGKSAIAILMKATAPFPAGSLRSEARRFVDFGFKGPEWIVPEKRVAGDLAEESPP